MRRTWPFLALLVGLMASQAEARHAATIAFMVDNPRGKHGRIAYDLRGDFGLDPDEVRARFGYYFDRFPVAVEGPGADRRPGRAHESLG